MADQGHYSGKTTAEGKFSFDGVKPGRYSLKVELEGYQLSEGPSGYVLVGPNGLTGKLNLKLVAPSTVSGTILETDEKPSTACNVDLLSVPRGGNGTWRSIAAANCQADGTFSFPKVLAGR